MAAHRRRLRRVGGECPAMAARRATRPVLTASSSGQGSPTSAPKRSRKLRSWRRIVTPFGESVGLVVVPAGPERCLQSNAATGQPGPHRPDGDTERRGDLGVREVRQGEQQEDLTFRAPQASETFDQHAAQPLSINAILDLGVQPHAVSSRSLRRAVSAPPGTHLSSCQVGRNPMEPWICIGGVVVEPVSLCEGSDKDVAREVPRRFGTHPSAQVSVDPAVVTFEHDLEQLGFVNRCADEIAVGSRGRQGALGRLRSRSGGEIGNRLRAVVHPARKVVGRPPTGCVRPRASLVGKVVVPQSGATVEAGRDSIVPCR